MFGGATRAVLSALVAELPAAAWNLIAVVSLLFKRKLRDPGCLERWMVLQPAQGDPVHLLLIFHGR